MSKVWISLASLAAVGLIAAAGALLQAGSGAAAETADAAAGGFKPVAPLEVVMENVDDIFAKVEKQTASKEEKKLNPKEREALKKEALFLSELFNIVRFHKTEKDWSEWSTKNRDQLLALAKDSGGADAKALKAAHDSIDKTCQACHDKYRDK